jgi:hypothetical protein
MIRRSALFEGVVTGLIGAGSVALWFFILDLISGRPFFTPAILGAGVLGALGGGFGGRGMLAHVLIYTVFHVAAFIAVGILAAQATQALERRPSRVAGFAILFAVLELAFLAGTAVLAGSELFGAYAWWQFGVANLIAALLMGRYLWRITHPQEEWDWEKENDAHFHGDRGRRARA